LALRLTLRRQGFSGLSSGTLPAVISDGVPCEAKVESRMERKDSTFSRLPKM